MVKRTTIELDEELLARAKRAMGIRSTRGTVEEALRRVADQEEGAQQRRADDQNRYFERLPTMADLEVLASEEMWR